MRECPKHPGANAGPFGESCVWCTGQMPAVRGSFMHRGDRESLAEQLGVPIESRSDLDRVQRENPQVRIVEKGSQQDQANEALRDWARRPADQRGPLPDECRPRRTENPVKALDGHRILARIRKEKADERRKQADE